MTSKGRYRGPRAARRTGQRVKPLSSRRRRCAGCGELKGFLFNNKKCSRCFKEGGY